MVHINSWPGYTGCMNVFRAESILSKVVRYLLESGTLWAIIGRLGSVSRPYPIRINDWSNANVSCILMAERSMMIECLILSW